MSPTFAAVDPRFAQAHTGSGGLIFAGSAFYGVIPGWREGI